MYINIDENKIPEIKKTVIENYNYGKSSADFTSDMHEKKDDDGIRAKVTKNPTWASKNLSMGSASNSSFDNLNTSGVVHNVKGRGSVPASHLEKKGSQMFENFSGSSADAERDTLHEYRGGGIGSINKSFSKPTVSSLDVHNPKAVDEILNSLIDHYIPAMLIPPTRHCSKLLIFYHANAEDIGQAYQFCSEINQKMDVS